MAGKALLCLIVVLSSSPLARGGVQLHLALPRLGWFTYFASTPATLSRRIKTADSNEFAKTFDLPATGQGITSFSLSVADSTYRDTVSSQSAVPASAVILKSPQDLDAGNWAVAIGVYDGPAIVSFFQYRLAGAGATVLDSSLAADAVSAGLWTGVNDYFEFPANNAGVSQNGLTQTGPSSFYSFDIPEPRAGLLIALAALSVISRKRR